MRRADQAWISFSTGGSSRKDGRTNAAVQATDGKILPAYKPVMVPDRRAMLLDRDASPALL